MTNYGSKIGQNIKEPLETITTRDRFGLVTIKGIDYRIVDIGLRMLELHELVVWMPGISGRLYH